MGAEELADALSIPQNLKTLDLSLPVNDIGPEGCRRIAVAIPRGLGELKLVYWVDVGVSLFGGCFL